MNNTRKVKDLKDRDVFLLKLLAEEFLLVTRDQVEALTDMGTRTANKWLGRLVKDGFLARRRFSGSREPRYFVYYLGDRAAEALERDPEELRHRRRRAGQFKAEAMEHEYVLNWIRIRFVTAGRQYMEYKLERWLSSENDLWDAIKLGLQPDGYVEFSVGERQFSYFIEVDRDTERGKYIREKIGAYREYEDTGRFMRQFPGRCFRVLFVTETRSRGTTLTKLFPSDSFWTATIDDVRSNSLLDDYWRSKSDKELSLKSEFRSESGRSSEVIREIDVPEPPAPVPTSRVPTNHDLQSGIQNRRASVHRGRRESRIFGGEEDINWRGLVVAWAAVFVLGVILGALVGIVIRGIWWIQDQTAF